VHFSYWRHRIAVAGDKHGHIVLILTSANKHLSCTINASHFLIIACAYIPATMTFQNSTLVLTVINFNTDSIERFDVCRLPFLPIGIVAYSAGKIFYTNKGLIRFKSRIAKLLKFSHLQLSGFASSIPKQRVNPSMCTRTLSEAYHLPFPYQNAYISTVIPVCIHNGLKFSNALY